MSAPIAPPAGEHATEYAYSGPCTHCGHLPDEHGDNYACLRAGHYGNRYAPGVSPSPAKGADDA